MFSLIYCLMMLFPDRFYHCCSRSKVISKMVMVTCLQIRMMMATMLILWVAARSCKMMGILLLLIYISNIGHCLDVSVING